MIKPIVTSIKIFGFALLINSCSSNSIKLDFICDATETINNNADLSYSKKISSFAQLTNEPSLSNPTKDLI